MMIPKALFVILLCMSAVKMEPEDISYSGEGEATAMSGTPDPQFINSDGDLISTLSSMDSEFITVAESNLDESLNDNTTTTKEESTEKASTTTTLAPVTTTLTTDTITTTTPDPTTTSETTTTSMETTTTTTTTSTDITTTPKPTTTTTTKKPTTTTRRTTRKTTTKSPTTKLTTTTVFPAPGEATTVSKSSGDLCEFVDNDLKCDIEIMCYGDGELDCSDNLDVPPSEPSILNKIFSPTFEEIFEEYDDVGGETIPTFPPDQVGKTMFPSLFKFGSLATAVKTSTMISTPEELTTEDKVTQQETTVVVTTTTERQTQPTTSTTVSTEAATTVSTTITEETTIISQTEISANTSVDEIGNMTSTTTDSLTAENYTMVPEDTSTVDNSGSVEISEDGTVKRRKREDVGKQLPSAASAMSVSMHIAALEGPRQKDRVRTCRITGNMVCSPTPTRDFCKGRSACQVVTGTSKTSEKTSSAKSLVNWTIAVIVMCIIAGILTVSIVVYFVVTSWKKLKVQPQSGVTTLTYVNSTPP